MLRITSDQIVRPGRLGSFKKPIIGFIGRNRNRFTGDNRQGNPAYGIQHFLDPIPRQLETRSPKHCLVLRKHGF